MEIVYVIAILAAFLLGAWVRRPVLPAPRARPPEHEANAEEPFAEKPDGERPPMWRQVDNVMNYNGTNQE